MTQDSTHLPVFELTRGEIRESLHYGSIAVVDVQGKMIAYFGDPGTVTYLRSTAKPLQALPFIERGGNSIYQLLPSEIALICASHAGMDEHVATVRSIQAKTGVYEKELLCGVHQPIHEATAEAMRKRGEAPSPNRHNCSGKHTAMLAFAHWQGWPTSDYIDPAHPVQQAIMQTFSEMSDLKISDLEIGTDGCSAPNFAVPLRNAALAFARLCDPRQLPKPRAEACQMITAAMTAHPNMVAGPGRFDTCLMEVTGGRIVAKGGAEGYQGIGIMPGALAPGSPGLGIAIKISDGDLKGRARPTVAIETLRQLNALTSTEIANLKDFSPISPIHNWRKLIVGQARTCFELNFC